MSFYTGPLRALARRHLERRAAEGRRDDAGRLPAAARRADGAGRQDAHARRRRGHGAARHRSQLHHRRARGRMRLRSLRARRRPARRRARTGATIRRSPRYNRYLNDKGYAGDNPWHDWANAAQGEGNALASGWAMRHARKPARVTEEDSETPYMTRRAMDFMTRSRRRALVPAPLLHQAALALYRAGALQRHVRRRRRAAGRALRAGAARSASRVSRVHGAAREPAPSRATRCARR